MNQESTGSAGKGVTIVYDGECPVCSSYLRHLRLKNNVGRVDLVDARGNPALVKSLAEQGCSLDAGMVVYVGTCRYHGADAIRALALMSGRRTFFNRINYHMFRSRTLAGLLYPVLRLGRRILLRLLGRKPLDDALRSIQTPKLD